MFIGTLGDVYSCLYSVFPVVSVISHLELAVGSCIALFGFSVVPGSTFGTSCLYPWF